MRKTQELTDPKSCMSRARPDEMTFVLLGRDDAAPVAIRAWIEERIRLGKNTPGDPQILEAEACIRAGWPSHDLTAAAKRCLTKPGVMEKLTRRLQSDEIVDG